MPDDIDINTEAKNKLIDNTELNKKLRDIFDGKIVRKDLTKKIRQGAKCPGICLGISLGAVLQF